jgi:hypothetical protein
MVQKRRVWDAGALAMLLSCPYIVVMAEACQVLNASLHCILDFSRIHVHRVTAIFMMIILTLPTPVHPPITKLHSAQVNLPFFSFVYL